MPAERAQYGWDPRTRSYRRGRHVGRGSIVPPAQVRKWLDEFLDALGLELVGATVRLRSRELDLQAWRTAMEEGITSAHLGAAALAFGGWSHLGREDVKRVGQTLQGQLERLNALCR